MTNEKQLYRIYAQKEGITMIGHTDEITQEEITKAATNLLMTALDEKLDMQPFVVLPITTKERFDTGCINFCPRCGNNIAEYELEQNEDFDCFHCEASLSVSCSVNDF